MTDVAPRAGRPAGRLVDEPSGAVPRGLTAAHFDIQAGRAVRADAEEIFAFLADLENHWLIAGRFVEVVDLTGPAGARSGGHVRVRGPLGVRRTATTRVDFVRPPNEMAGTAELSGGTVARVRWRLHPADGQTVVTRGATLERAGRWDRLLLRAGGLLWMRRRFEGALRALDERLARTPAARS